MRHIYSHLDKVLRSDKLTIEEKINCLCDRLASTALVNAVTASVFIFSCFPFDDLQLLVNGVKVAGSAKHAISNFWGSKVMKEFFNSQRIFSHYDFPLVYWDVVKGALLGFSDFFCIFVTKHVTHFNGTNCMLLRFNADKLNTYLSCCF